MSDTPRTDAFNWNEGDYDDAFYSLFDFAKQLERELNASNAIIRQQQLLDEENLSLRQRIKRLEEAGDEMVNKGWNEPHLANAWRNAKEAKP